MLVEVPELKSMVQGCSAVLGIPGRQAVQVFGVSGMGWGGRARDGAAARAGRRLPNHFGVFWC